MTLNQDVYEEEVRKTEEDEETEEPVDDEFERKFRHNRHKRQTEKRIFRRKKVKRRKIDKKPNLNCKKSKSLCETQGNEVFTSLNTLTFNYVYFHLLKLVVKMGNVMESVNNFR